MVHFALSFVASPLGMLTRKLLAMLVRKRDRTVGLPVGAKLALGDGDIEECLWADRELVNGVARNMGERSDSEAPEEASSTEEALATAQLPCRNSAAPSSGPVGIAISLACLIVTVFVADIMAAAWRQHCCRVPLRYSARGL